MNIYKNPTCFSRWSVGRSSSRNEATGTQKAYLVNDDWGAGVTKLIMVLDKIIKADSVSKRCSKVGLTIG